MRLPAGAVQVPAHRGATALYHARPEVELIQRFGRWQSSAFQLYLWEAHETAKGLSTAMASDRTVLHAGAPA